MLSVDQIKKIVQEKPRRDYIRAGVSHQERLQLHSEMILTKSSLPKSYHELIAWLGSSNPELLPADKMERFKQLCTTPLPTVSLTGDIYTYLYRVFEGQDAYSRYKFKDNNNEADWKENSDDSFWRTTGFQAMQTAIDSVWILELPEIQESDLPEPTDRLINISQVIDIDVDRDNNCRWLIFESEDRLYVYDDTSIRTFEFKDKKVGTEIYALTHGLGFCPARMFWSDQLQAGNFINKRAPLTHVLGDLDWFLVLKVFKRYMDMANAYPITAAYETDNDYQDVTPTDKDGRPVPQQPAKNSFIGPGTLWTVRPPIQGEPDAMSNPVKLISPDIATLQHHTDNLDALAVEIFRKVTGYGGEPENNQAKNEKQIMSGFESQMIVLQKIASNFEKIQAFAEKVKIMMRYGVDAIEDIAIDYGSRFFLISVDDLTEEIKTGKESGLDEGMIEALTDELLETKFRNDKGSLMRARILRDIDPLPDKSIPEAIEIKNAGGIDEINFVIKVNKINFAKRFDREQMPLQFFAENKSYDQKINLIKEEFLKYASEINSGQQRPEVLDQRDRQVLVARPADADNSGQERPEDSTEGLVRTDL